MSRLNKRKILELLFQASCIETPVLSRYFKSVWVGEEIIQRIKVSKRKMKI